MGPRVFVKRTLCIPTLSDLSDLSHCTRALALISMQGGSPRVVVSTAVLYARVRVSFPGLGCLNETKMFLPHPGRDPRVVVSTAVLHARARGSFPGLGGLNETKMFLPHPLVKLSTVGSFRDREVANSASDLQGFYFESCLWTCLKGSVISLI